MKKFYLLIVSFLFLTQISIGQIKNSNEKDIAEFYDAVKKRIEINGGKVSFDIRLKGWKAGWIFKNSDTKSAIKNNAIFLKLGLTNTKDFFSFNKFDFKNNNGLLVGLGFQHGFDKVFLNEDENRNPLSLQSNTFSLTYQYDKFNNLEPGDSEFRKSTPIVLTANWGYSKYFWHYKNSYYIKYAFVPTVNVSGNIIDYNKSDLQNYLLVDNISNLTDFITTSNKNFDGKYGVIDNNIQNVQLALSSPIVFDYKSSWLPILAPIPYMSILANSSQKPIYNAGIAIGLLAQPLLGEKTDKYEEEEGISGLYRKFNVPSFLTVSIDWNNQGGIGSKPNYFITGTIALK